jgi:hypothetical protein
VNAPEPLQPYLALFTIAHHIPGRIRLRISHPADGGFFPVSGSGDRLEKALRNVPGIRRIHFNILARSCTVEYDDQMIPDRAWPDLLAHHASPEALALLEGLRQALNLEPEP